MAKVFSNLTGDRNIRIAQKGARGALGANVYMMTVRYVRLNLEQLRTCERIVLDCTDDIRMATVLYDILMGAQAKGGAFLFARIRSHRPGRINANYQSNPRLILERFSYVYRTATISSYTGHETHRLRGFRSGKGFFSASRPRPALINCSPGTVGQGRAYHCLSRLNT